MTHPVFMAMYDNVWQCMPLYDYIWLSMAMHDYVWLCIAIYDYVWLCMTMFDYGWLCMAMDMYGFIWRFICVRKSLWTKVLKRPQEMSSVKKNNRIIMRLAIIQHSPVVSFIKIWSFIANFSNLSIIVPLKLEKKIQLLWIFRDTISKCLITIRKNTPLPASSSYSSPSIELKLLVNHYESPCTTK